MAIVSTLGVATWDSVHSSIAPTFAKSDNSNSSVVAIEVVIVIVIVIVIAICDSTVGSDPLTIVATSLQFHLSSLCADAHRQTLVYIYIYIHT